jgi:hypothetical protein
LDKNELIAILFDWNFWRQQVDTGIPRPEYIEYFRYLAGSKQVLTITGPRRAGKTWSMRQMLADAMNSGVNRENLLFVNFEDPRFPSLDLKLMDQTYSVYQEFLRPQGEITLFLDEVQEVPGWEKWVRKTHELRQARLVISGSNARMLSRELGTLLTGRHIDLQVFPLSFREFLEFNGFKKVDPLDQIAHATEIKGWLRQYIEFGSFPEVALSRQKKEILLGYFDDLITRDLLKRYKIRKAEELKALIKFYLSNAGNLITFSSAAKFLNLTVSTIEKFSGYLQDVYLVFFLKRFSFKVKEQEKSPRKVYAIDSGLCNTIGFRFSKNSGRLAENVVFLALLRRQARQPDMELYYWKDMQHREVDFLIKQGMEVSELIQVCWDVSDTKTRTREIRGLLKAMHELKLSEAIIITDEHSAVETLEGGTINYIPLYKWLLNDGGRI